MGQGIAQAFAIRSRSARLANVGEKINLEKVFCHEDHEEKNGKSMIYFAYANYFCSPNAYEGLAVALTAIKLRIFPFALSLSKGEWKNPGSIS
ncbi:hypothetical protein EQU24_13875 [Methylotuvimicrobium buryatense]|uniref:Uncharacterized protein n=1 Tax=Methylotuvimicrobium buryatense TaxID=95641 RepID=A0A4P9UU65_METBY|nr:hypothetical protein EQU24_13875 [Methylotuvimicrobium buryatense]